MTNTQHYSFKTTAELAVKEIMNAFGIEPYKCTVTFKNCTVLMMSFWNNTRETKDDGTLDFGAYGWIVSTISRMINSVDAIDAAKLTHATKRVMEIRAEYNESVKKSRAERMAAARQMRLRTAIQGL